MTITAIPARDLSRISTSLVLRTCAADGTSHDGFVWPEAGPVACSDWESIAECGHGLHGALWGEGDGSLFRWQEDARWQVLEVPTDTIVDLGGKVKFPAATVLFTGGRLAATAFLAERAPGRAIIGETATAGYRGIATAGYRGTATAMRPVPATCCIACPSGNVQAKPTESISGQHFSCDVSCGEGSS